MKVKVRYEADGAESDWLPYPSRLSYIHVGRCIANGCYKEAARIMLEITNIRVERLNDISETDAIAEGIDAKLCREYHFKSPVAHILNPAAYHAFAGLWESINGKDSWNANPWVWVIEFKRIENDNG